MRPSVLLAVSFIGAAMIGSAYLGCDSSPGKPPATPVPHARGASDPAIEGVPGAPTGTPLASAAWYRLDLGPAARCTAGQPCAATLVVTARGDYHVNAEYPTKFVPGAAPAELGTAATSFAIEGERRGVLKIEVTPTRPGTYTLEGKFKLSVCNAGNCQIESPVVAVPITAS